MPAYIADVEFLRDLLNHMNLRAIPHAEAWGYGM